VRRRFILTVAFVLGSSLPARADSGVVLGNELNPTGLIPGITTDPLGSSLLIQYPRLPTGLLKAKPFLYPQLKQVEAHPDWWRSAWADVGFITDLANTSAASFSDYGDWSSGIVASFGFWAENRKNANYLSGLAGSIGRSDEYYNFRFGRLGVLNVDLGYSGAPHVISTNARFMWHGVGTSNLTLPPDLTPGAVTPAQAEAALAEVPESRLSVTRTKTGLAITYTPWEAWELFFSASNEWRDGTEPVGSAFWFPSRGAAGLVKPTKYQTADLSAGVRFKGEEVQANLVYSGSLFRNDFTSLTWGNPGLGLPPGSFVPERGRMASAPDNDYHTVKGDLAWAVLSNVRFAASASYSAMSQDEALLPPVINSGLTPVNLGHWNTLDALSRKTAKAAIETINGFAQLRWTPKAGVGLTVEARYRNEDNETDYLALNPLTMEYGYMGLDGALSRIYVPTTPGSNVPVRNVPFATDEIKLSAKLDYRISARTRLNLSFAHEETERLYREVVASNDDIAEAQLSSTGFEWGTVRFSYTYADRSGSTYVSDPYRFARSSSFPGYLPRTPGGDPPFTLAQFRKYDVADRREHALKAQSNFILSEREDLQLTGSYRRSDYDAEYGLRALKTYDVNMSYTNQVSSALTLVAFYGFQFHGRKTSSISAVNTPSSDSTAGGPNYPLSNAWSENDRDESHVLGANVNYQLERLTLDLNYLYSLATSGFAYSFAGLGAITPGLTPLDAGTEFPDQSFDHRVLEAAVGWAYSERVSLRWYYRLEHEQLDDFHYTGLTNVIGNHLLDGSMPEDYTAHVVGFFTQYRF
jgi:MtrB/PioB family decaheme-associated outer membrane protein